MFVLPLLLSWCHALLCFLIILTLISIMSTAVGANGSGKTNFFHGKWQVLNDSCSGFYPVDSIFYFYFFSREFFSFQILGPILKCVFIFYIFFIAIRFVLSDLFQNLRSDDRQALLHVCLTKCLILSSSHYVGSFVFIFIFGNRWIIYLVNSFYCTLYSTGRRRAPSLICVCGDCLR